jgi:hypothetical protein
MKLYHGSLDIIVAPVIIRPTRLLDYGMGFYTTTSFEQAKQWAHRRLGKNSGTAYVNCYELDEKVIATMQVLCFKEPTEEWLDFVMTNRTQPDFVHSYDLVYGPVANDRVYVAFALYESNVLDKEGLIRELRTYALVDQMLFHTNNALKHLKYIESKTIIV